MPDTLSMVKDRIQPITLTHIYVGVGWKATGGGNKGVVGWAKKKVGTDLDVCGIALDEFGAARGIAWFDDRDPYDDGSLVVSEDNTSGKGPGDDEFIAADLTRISSQVKTLVFEVSAFKPKVTFANVSSVTTRIVDQSGTPQMEIGKSVLPIDAAFTAVALCKVTRNDSGLWEFTATETFGYGKTKAELIALAKRV